MTFSFVDVLGQSYKAYTNDNSEFIPNQEVLEGTYTMLSISDKSDIDDDLISLLGQDYDEDFYKLDQLLLTAMIKTISTDEIQQLIKEIENYIEQNFNQNESNIQISGLSVFINDFTKSDVTMPFGGIKKSGYGRDGGMDGIYSHGQTKRVSKRLY